VFEETGLAEDGKAGLVADDGIPQQIGAELASIVLPLFAFKMVVVSVVEDRVQVVVDMGVLGLLFRGNGGSRRRHGNEENK
jgi:hypothetical protein